jgi:hypothetical protein
MGCTVRSALAVWGRRGDEIPCEMILGFKKHKFGVPDLCDYIYPLLGFYACTGDLDSL